jgi:hypothetical protein
VTEKIAGGYYIKARKIKNSPVHKMPPHVREIWDYCLREVNHSVGFMGPYKIERGQMIRDYSEIREDLSWYIGYRKMMYDENQTKKAMKALRDALMITTTRVPGGVLITVLNYDFYNDPKNYVSTDESTSESTTKALLKHQASTTYNKKDKKNNNKEINKPENVTEQTWNDVLILRKSKKAPLTERALKGIIREAEKAGWSIEAAFEEMCLRGWTGFKAEWVENPKNQSNQQTSFSSKTNGYTTGVEQE